MRIYPDSKFMVPTWGPSVSKLAPWTLLSGYTYKSYQISTVGCLHYNMYHSVIYIQLCILVHLIHAYFECSVVCALWINRRYIHYPVIHISWTMLLSWCIDTDFITNNRMTHRHIRCHVLSLFPLQLTPPYGIVIPSHHHNLSYIMEQYKRLP